MISDNHRVQAMAGGWMWELIGTDIHVIPLEDYKPHGWSKCWCHPRLDVRDDGMGLVIHNAMDRRELVTRLH